jgi:hypothetical protein
MKVLKEYLVTHYTADNTRLGSYTLYGVSYDEVSDKVENRLTADTARVFLDYKGESVFEDWMLV